MREENIEIFKDTEKLCRTNPFLIQTWKESSANQKLILEKDVIDISSSKKRDNPAQIIVSKNRTFEAAMKYSGKKSAVLNFASASNPGGGVVNGSSAQEECLCRCSTLYFNLTEDFMWKNFYLPHRHAHNPLHNDDLIYSPDVMIFKTDDSRPVLMSQEDWKKVNVITCAAPNLRENPSNIHNPSDGIKSVTINDKDLQALHERRGEKIIQAAIAGNNDVLILGAFGCGAFRNKPSVVARAYKNLIEKFKDYFETIEFAVYCSPQNDSNYQIFRSTLLPQN